MTDNTLNNNILKIIDNIKWLYCKCF